MTSQIRSHIEYLMQTDIIRCFVYTQTDSKNLALLTGFQYDYNLEVAYFLLGHPVY